MMSVLLSDAEWCALMSMCGEQLVPVLLSSNKVDNQDMELVLADHFSGLALFALLEKLAASL